MSEDEKLLLKRIDKKIKDHMYDPTNFQRNKISKVLRERLSIFISKDTFNHNEDYMAVMLNELIWMVVEFIAENKTSGSER
jgi:hypothetical protein